MMTPASYSPDRSAGSMSEKSSSDVFRASGNASPSRKFAVVYLPGIAMRRPPDRTSSVEIGRFEIRSGPQPRPSAPPASSRTYRSAQYA
jgi:hypothetical protein